MPIQGLYECFTHWHKDGAVWIISDTHFGDKELELAVPGRPSAEAIVKAINSKVGKNDTLICLGDVGDLTYVAQLKGYKILIMGNHDKGRTNYKYNGWTEWFDKNNLFNEVYEGPLMISEKLILSHEPINVPWAFNIHGHVHDFKHKNDERHFNVCSDVINYTPINFNQWMKQGHLSKIETLHRTTIDTATVKKSKRETKKNAKRNISCY